MKFVDTLGRVDKFKKREEKAKEIKARVVQKVQERQQHIRPNSLREMIELAKKQATS